MSTIVNRYQIAARVERLPLSSWHNKMRLAAKHCLTSIKGRVPHSRFC
jgi:hypothetical protein